MGRALIGPKSLKIKKRPDEIREIFPCIITTFSSVTLFYFLFMKFGSCPNQTKQTNKKDNKGCKYLMSHQEKRQGKTQYSRQHSELHNSFSFKTRFQKLTETRGIEITPAGFLGLTVLRSVLHYPIHCSHTTMMFLSLQKRPEDIFSFISQC